MKANAICVFVVRDGLKSFQITRSDHKSQIHRQFVGFF